MTNCQGCHQREAVVHLTHVADDRVTTVHLCSRCAAERGIATDPVSLGPPLAALFATLTPIVPEPTAALDGASGACPMCGATLADIRASGRLRCATCWTTYAPQLRDLVRRLHGATVHTGKQALDSAGDEGGERRLRARLVQALRDAVAAEAFEEAAAIRDSLRRLEGVE